ncbi:MAG: methyltransferase domain-containing protein [Nitrospira sp.]|nr:MAG: methyltransferase domain-containing protein [Nitrospira sp.]
MRFLGLLIIYLSRICARVGSLVYEVNEFLNGLLPALLPAEELTRLIRVHYEGMYRDAATHYSAIVLEWGLEPWEEEVIAQHKIQSGITVVLGAGVGRESIALAQRGLRVIGLDVNHEALSFAAQTARSKFIDMACVQASFLALPIVPGQIDYLFLSSIMYSSVPGRHARQAWLRNLSTHLKVGGVALVSFLIDRTGKSGPPRLAHRLSSWLAGLPGANHAYQLGDVFSGGHFLHAFVTEEELRSEMIETGATIIQLNWDRQFAVLTWPS